jgi:hypothetical protein
VQVRQIAAVVGREIVAIGTQASITAKSTAEPVRAR